MSLGGRRSVPPHHVVPPRAPLGRLALTEAELEHWGEELGRTAHAPLAVLLSGELGAGKTTLARAICRGYGVEEWVTSPTYTIVHHLVSPRGPVIHIDLYRLRGAEELTGIGWDELLAERALVLVEWPERAAGRLPDESVHLVLEHAPGDPARRVLLAG